MTEAPILLSFDALIRRVQDASWSHEVFIIAVDGRSGSGKSTLAGQLARPLGAQVVHGDDFHQLMPEQQRAALSPEQGYMQYFDWQRLRAELITVRNGNSSSLLAYDWTGRGSRQVHVYPEGRLIVEGVYTLRSELRHLYDLKVYVETPESLRRDRLRERTWDDPAWMQRWEAAEHWYEQHHNPRGAAEVVISGVGE